MTASRKQERKKDLPPTTPPTIAPILVPPLFLAPEADEPVTTVPGGMVVVYGTVIVYTWPS